MAPHVHCITAFADALRRGWVPYGPDVSAAWLLAIAADPAAWLVAYLDPNGTVPLPDGRVVPKLPSREWWLWDGDFAGVILLRRQAGTEALPPFVNGHVFYSVVPWRQNRGYATDALRHLLPFARESGLRWLDVGCSADNPASSSVILKNGGRLFDVRPDPVTPDSMVELYRVQVASIA